MRTEWDEAKNEANFAKHGLWFESFEGFDAEPVVLIDSRKDYGEVRFRAFGRLMGKPIQSLTRSAGAICGQSAFAVRTRRR